MSVPLRVSVLCFLLASMADACAATLVVTRGDDPAPGACAAADCSLREALDAAVATPGEDTIVLGAGQYTVTRGALAVYGTVLIQGQSAAATRIVGSGDFDLLALTPLGALTLEGMTLSSQRQAVVFDSGSVVLRFVEVPTGGGAVSGAAGSGPASVRVEHAALGGALACECGAGSVQASDSVLDSVLVFNGSADLVLDRVELAGPASVPYGIAFTSSGTATIRDSTIRDQAVPLVLDGAGGDVRIRRTRFIGNTGPLHGSRDGMVWIEDAEFRDNVVGDDALADGLPAVLLAQDDTAWRISRALFTGNRGGGGSAPDRIGSSLRVLAGGNVTMSDVTFYDETFRSGVVNGVGHAIGVDTAGETAILWLFNATLRIGPAVPSNAVASLIAVRGANANVRVFNGILHGNCAFASGAAMFQAEGNLESPGDTCQLPAAGNSVSVAPMELFLGPLTDNGGFTRTFLPTRYSPAVDHGATIWCNVAGAIFSRVDQRRFVRPAGQGCDSGAAEFDSVSDLIYADGSDATG
ncbi:MAG TPA: choice-of-anchor Q domain-containing protein [Dokdonella sp.]|uniref:choice-of-anchor Q domain-containing protein n=1 Tax=Dokdonella sp. TaxID=2291710 RepID=UPI002C5D2A18|nr:choice-of-anchor Q domain-containing protein [Dokdonella sp.]HUD42535.1 choice-of-anchor Q domain-containing protein [Dokdonella sp.]